MLHTLKKLLGIAPKVNFQDLVQNGAIVLDVRSPSEYKQDHIKGSINAPLNELLKHISNIKKDTPIISCCASGMRSATAKSILKSNGFEQVYNGGSWSSLANKIT